MIDMKHLVKGVAFTLFTEIIYTLQRITSGNCAVLHEWLTSQETFL